MTDERGWPAGAPPSFADEHLLDLLEETSTQRIDELDFGLIAMDRSGAVVGYNAHESKRAGLDRDRVVGRNFFVEIGPCTNNDLVAKRFRSGEELVRGPSGSILPSGSGDRQRRAAGTASVLLPMPCRAGGDRR